MDQPLKSQIIPIVGLQNPPVPFPYSMWAWDTSNYAGSKPYACVDVFSKGYESGPEEEANFAYIYDQLKNYSGMFVLRIGQVHSKHIMMPISNFEGIEKAYEFIKEKDDDNWYEAYDDELLELTKLYACFQNDTVPCPNCGNDGRPYGADGGIEQDELKCNACDYKMPRKKFEAALIDLGEYLVKHNATRRIFPEDYEDDK